jgi:hypothetical protein
MSEGNEQRKTVKLKGVPLDILLQFEIRSEGNNVPYDVPYDEKRSFRQEKRRT